MSGEAGTPETWTVQGSIYEHMAAEIVAVSPDGEHAIAQVWKHPEALDRAHLMASAPNLLAALRATVGMMLNAKIDLEVGATKAKVIIALSSALKRTEAAIAKVEAKP